MDKFIAGSGGGGGKGGGGGSRTPSTDPDSLNSRSFGRIVDLISEGPIEGLVDGNKSIFLDNTPLENTDGTSNFDDVIIKTKSGTSNQTVLDGFVEAANIISNPQSGVEIDSTGQTFTISDPSVDSVIFLLSVPTLQKIKNNGDTLGTEFKYQFQRSLAGGGFTNILGEQTINGRTADLYQKQYEFDISGLAENQFPVRFKLVRTSDDDTAFMNGNDEDGNPNSDTFISHTSKFYVTSHTLVKQQGANQSGTYTHAGTTITITTGANHNLEVGDSIGCEFAGGTNNQRMTVASVVSETVFTAQHTQSRNGSGNVTFGRRFNYPDCALVGLRINAEQFNSVPKRSYLIKGIKVKIPNGVTVDSNNGRIIYPSGYVFNGTLGAAQWTTDPSWCLFDLLTSQRYGCGDFISANELDVYSFYAASVYSSENVTFQDRLGNGVVQTITEPRFSLNVNIQTRQDVFKVVNSLCSVFRAMPLYMSGNFSLIQDRAGLDPTFQFTNANVTPDGFSYSGSSSKTRATVIVVKYFDIELRDAAYEQVIDNDALLRYGAIIKNINSFGVTSRHQARRLGKWFLTTLATETDVVSFTTTIQAGALITPGQIIEVMDDVKSGVRRGGQITSVKTVGGNSVIGIDNITDLPTLGGGLDGELTVILPDGQLSLRPDGSESKVGLPIASNGIDTTNKEITVSGRFKKKVNDSSGNKPFLDNTRQPNPTYTTTLDNADPNVGSFWVIETTGNNSEIQTQLYKVVAIEEADDFQYTVTAVLHNESKYAAVEQNEVLEHRDFTNLDLVPESPSDWATDSGGTVYPIEQLYKDKNQVKVRLLIAWKPVLGVNRYELKYRKDKGGFITVEIQDPSFSIDDINVSKSVGSAKFDLRVRSISASGKKSHSPLVKNNFSVIGKNAKPSQVSSDFAATLDPNLGVVLSWTPIVATYPNFADLDIKGYRIYEGTYGSGTYLGEYKATSVNVPTLPSSTDNAKTYSIKAIDDDGNVSVNARSTTLTIEDPNQPATLSGFYRDDNYILNWSASVVSGNRFAIKEYEVRRGTDLIATTNALSFSVPVTWQTAQTFKVRAIDITGRESTDKELNAPYSKASAPNIIYTYEGSKIRLSWGKPTEGATKIRDYVIKASKTDNTDFNSAQDIDVTNTESYLFEPSSDATSKTYLNPDNPRRFFIAARDVNDHLGDVGRTGILNYPDVSMSKSPEPTNLTAVVRGASAFVSWDEVPLPVITKDIGTVVNGLPIAFYKIYRENAGTVEADIGSPDFQQNGTSIAEEVIWTDSTQRYFVRAVDINGNDGILKDVDFTVALPSPVTNLTNEIIDNNVLLRWTESAVGVGQLPIKHYNVYRNSLSDLVGQKLGTFTTVFEQVGGQKSYILVPVNTAGNQAAAPHATTIAEVNEPPDFVLTDDFQSALTGSGITSVNSFFENNGLFFCIDPTRTWREHFDPSNNDTSRTFGVYGGSTVYALPTENSGSFEEVIDTQATIASTRIEGTLGLVDSEKVGDGYSVVNKIWIAPDAGGGSQGTFVLKGSGSGTRINVLGQDFRFIKVRYEFTGANNNDLIKVNSSRVKLFLKRKTDQGRVTILGSAAGGTNGVTVPFNETFIDVNSIQLSIQGSTSAAKYAIYDFVDAANPEQGFKIFVFTTTGTFPTANTTVDFTVRGV